jgi:hypothetical protein
MQMNVGDRVKVIEQIMGGENYPWVPNLVGCTGTIVKTISETPVAHEPLEELVCLVKMDVPFKIKRPWEGGIEGSGFDYNPPDEEKHEEDEWHFCERELDKI